MADALSGFVRLALNVLFISDPIRTAVGFLIGLLITVAYRILLAPLLSRLLLMPTLSGLEGWELIVIGIGIAHARTIKRYLSQDEPFDGNTVKALKLIALAKKNRVSKALIDKMYFNLYESHLASKRDPVDAVLGSAKQ